MDRIRYFFRFIRFFVSHNPVKSILTIVVIFMSIVLLKIDKRIDINYYVHTSYYDNGKYIYVMGRVTDNGQTNNSKLIYYDQDMGYNRGDIVAISEISEIFAFWVGMGIMMLIFHLLSLFVDEWDLLEIKYLSYRPFVEFHKDTDYVYYVINDKVISKSEYNQEGEYYYNRLDMRYNIIEYIENKRALDSFEGTRVDRRNKSINDIIS